MMANIVTMAIGGQLINHESHAKAFHVQFRTISEDTPEEKHGCRTRDDRLHDI